MPDDCEDCPTAKTGTVQRASTTSSNVQRMFERMVLVGVGEDARGDTTDSRKVVGLIAEFYLVDRGLRHRLPGVQSHMDHGRDTIQACS
jgi:hypothetical protein